MGLIHNVRVPLKDMPLDANIDLKMFGINGDIVIQGSGSIDDGDIEADLNRNLQTRFVGAKPIGTFVFVAEEASGGQPFAVEGATTPIFSPERATIAEIL